MTIKKTVTPAVVAANKANSQKASGPRTDAGKQKARTNATHHRLLAARLVLDTDGERADLEALVDWVYQDRQPEGAVECMLA